MAALRFLKIQLVTASLLLTCGVSFAEDTGLLDEVVRRQEIAGQLFEHELETLFSQAEKAGAVKAIELLEEAQDRIDGEEILSPRRKAALTRLVQNKMRKVRVARVRPSLYERQQRTTVRRTFDDDEVRQDLAAIRSLRQQGRLSEARRVANDLARKHPDHPIVAQLRRSLKTLRPLRETADLYEDKAERTAAALRDVEKSAQAVTGDVEYSRDFLAKTAKRKEKYVSGLARLTDKEKAILRALDEATETPIEFKDWSFEKVIGLLQEQLGHPLVVNRTAVEEQRIDYDLPISASIPQGVSKRTVLKRILNDLGLTYVVKNESIEVTSVLRAQNEMVVRYYQVDDLLPLGGLRPASELARQFDSRLGIRRPPVPVLQPPSTPGLTVDGIIEMIQRSIAPDTWEPHGPGSITYFAPTRTLIIRNSAEVINQFGTPPKR